MDRIEPINSKEMNDSRHSTMMRRATYASVSVALFLITVKLMAYLLTDSVSLLSSLIDSVLDSLASILNLVAVRHSLSPADDEHRFGHGKAEPLAGLGQATFVMGSSLFLVFESINRFVHPKAVEHGYAGILVMVISLIATICLVLYQRRVVRETGSVAIRADSIHYFSDLTLNLGVIAALVMSAFLGWWFADPLIAVFIAIYIIYTAWNIVTQSLDQLMDRELSPDERERISEIVYSQPGVISMHELRTRASGKDIFIQAHLDMDGEMKLTEAHKVADEVEARLREVYPNADIIIHQDPVEAGRP